jgi:hypothetical protein
MAGCDSIWLQDKEPQDCGEFTSLPRTSSHQDSLLAKYLIFGKKSWWVPIHPFYTKNCGSQQHLTKQPQRGSLVPHCSVTPQGEERPGVHSPLAKPSACFPPRDHGGPRVTFPSLSTMPNNFYSFPLHPS